VSAKPVGLVHDVLDAQVLDRNDQPMGKVDGIALELREGAPPRVAYVELDAATAWRRLGERFGRWARAVLRRRGGAPRRFTWQEVIEVTIHVKVDKA
jgi:hypothetical protein